MDSQKCNSPECKFTSKCRVEKELIKKISLDTGAKITYTLYECRLASNNEYNIDASRPLYSIEVTNETTAESSYLCCVSAEIKYAKELLSKLHRNLVMPFELKEIYAEIT